MSIRVLRKGEVEELTGLSSSSIDRLEARGEFPVRLQVSRGVVGWLSNEVDDWIAIRPRGVLASVRQPIESVQSVYEKVKARGSHV